MNSFAGMALRVKERSETATFYAALGLSVDEHRHGGPPHFEIGPSDSAVVLEIYKATGNYPNDAVMINVTDLDAVLGAINSAGAEVKQLSDGRLAYVKDPDDRTVLLIETTPLSPACGLAAKACVPCRGNTAVLSAKEIDALMDKLLNGWIVHEDSFGQCLKKTYNCRNFAAAVKFVFELAKVADAEDHHPDVSVYNYRLVDVLFTTKAIRGLSENDFIMAAKTDELFKRLSE